MSERAEEEPAPASPGADRSVGPLAALSTAGPLLAVLATAIGGRAAEALGGDMGRRFAIVVFSMACALALARLARPGSSSVVRALTAVLSLPFVAALIWPRSALPLTWLCGSAVVLGLEAVVYSGRIGWRLGTKTGWRVALVVVGVAAPLHLWSSAFVVIFNTQLVVAPARLAHRAPSAAPGEESMTLRASDGVELAATFTPAHRGAGAVVLVHGVADGQRRFAPWAARLAESGFHALRYDGRAHGRSEGAVVTYGQHEGLDLLAAVDHLRGRSGVNPSRVFVVAASMGGGTALAHARRLEERRVRGMILLAPPVDYRPLVMRRTAWLGPLRSSVLNGSGALARTYGEGAMTEWRPASGLANTSIPVLVLHGRDDATIPFELARGTEVWPNLEVIDGVGHDELSAVVLERRWDDVERFLARYSPRDAVPTHPPARPAPLH